MALANVLGGIAVLFLGLGITFFASRLSYMSEFGPGPGLLPLWIGIVLSACSVAIIVKALKGYRSQGGSFFQARTRQVAFMFVSLLVTILFIPVLGLSLGLALLTGFTMKTMGRHGWIPCVLVAVATAAVVRILFGHILDIPLPKGWIGF